MRTWFESILTGMTLYTNYVIIASIAIGILAQFVRGRMNPMRFI